MARLEVKAVVDIPAFQVIGRLISDRVYVELDDVVAHLTTAAARFDHAGANADIGSSIRAIRDGLAESAVTPPERSDK